MSRMDNRACSIYIRHVEKVSMHGWEIDNKGRPDLETRRIPENTACLGEYGRKRVSIISSTCYCPGYITGGQLVLDRATYICDRLV